MATLLAAGAALSMGLALPSFAAVASTDGTITFAEQPGAAPNYIFPFASCLYDSVNNIGQFQQLMYRPLYWFGLGTSTAMSPGISLAKQPVYNKTDTSVTITTKGWKFADGQVVNAESVMFFLNLLRADPIAYCGYEQGMGIPDEVRSVSASANTVRIVFTKAVNPTWMTDNFLSQITPLPNEWDRTSPTQSAKCASGAWGAPTTLSACMGVETYIDSLATNTSSFTDALWRAGVDGPWKLVSFDSAGNATFAPNTKYSGSPRPHVKYFKEVAFTSADQEASDLKSGSLDIGYIDPTTLPQRASSSKIGPNVSALAANYSLVAGSPWGFNEAVLNFNPANAKAAAISQLYIRQALQESVDQSTIISNVDRGYGFAAHGPLPPATPTAIAKPTANPYSFNLTAAKNLLIVHGWTEIAGVMTCTSPGVSVGECGANIPAGYTLNFNIVWPGDSASLNATFNLEIADWAQIGIVVTPNYDTANNVITDCSATSNFQICGLGSGWIYADSYFPTGEELYLPGGMANFGAYSDTHMTSLVGATTSTAIGLANYAAYAAQQLPVLYEPQVANTLEVVKTLKSAVGFTPNPIDNLTPEYYRF